MNLTDDEREDIRFALAYLAKSNREKAETAADDYLTLSRTLTEQASRCEALARKVTDCAEEYASGEKAT